MFKKNKNFIFAFDIYRMSAEINTFNGDNKTKGGLVVSFIFIALSILYALFTLINYFKYSTPSVIYFKENEQNTIKEFDMNDPFMIGLYIDAFPINESDINIQSYYMKYSLSGNDTEVYPINFEKCEYGKNVDVKYKDKLSSSRIDEMYCISEDLTNHPMLSSDEEYSEIYIFITFSEDINYYEGNLWLGVINSNNVVNHMKNNPISNIYFTGANTDISKNKYNDIHYYYQYIKYESDKGLFFEKTQSYNAKVFSNMEHSVINYDEMNETLIDISIGINNKDFDYYSRSYERIQLVIVEIYWIVDMILSIGGIIASYFTDKETSIEIVKYLFAKNINEKSLSEEISINNNNNQQKESTFKVLINNISQQNETIFKEKININNNQQNEAILKEKININNKQQNGTILKEKININNNNKINYLDNKIKQSDNKSKYLDNNNEIDEITDNKNTNYNIYSIEKKSNVDDDKRINVLNNLNYYHIIKSYFCFKDDKTKLINCVDDLISEELSIERILRRINDMEDQINYILNSLNLSNTHKNDKFDEINELIDKIDKNNNK